MISMDRFTEDIGGWIMKIFKIWVVPEAPGSFITKKNLSLNF